MSSLFGGLSRPHENGRLELRALPRGSPIATRYARHPHHHPVHWHLYLPRFAFHQEDSSLNCSGGSSQIILEPQVKPYSHVQGKPQKTTEQAYQS